MLSPHTNGTDLIERNGEQAMKPTETTTSEEDSHSDGLIFEDPFPTQSPGCSKIEVPKPKHVDGDILRMTMGQKIECECGRCKVDREGDHYMITGPMYHSKDSTSEWLICPHCNDRIKIHPVVDFIDANIKGLDGQL